MRNRTLALFIAAALLAGPAIADTEATTVSSAEEPRRAVRMLTSPRRRPIRFERFLRYENISDIEVREIQAVMREFLPGAIINIAGVTVGCPCEDGLTCSHQVWVVAHTAEQSNGIQLSRIDGQWVVGPLQDWWLHRDALDEKWQKAARRNGKFDAQGYMNELAQLSESIPQCVAAPAQ